MMAPVADDTDQSKDSQRADDDNCHDGEGLGQRLFSMRQRMRMMNTAKTAVPMKIKNSVNVTLTLAFKCSNAFVTLVAQGEADDDASQYNHRSDDDVRHVKQHPGQGR